MIVVLTSTRNVTKNVIVVLRSTRNVTKNVIVGYKWYTFYGHVILMCIHAFRFILKSLVDVMVKSLLL